MRRAGRPPNRWNLNHSLRKTAITTIGNNPPFSPAAPWICSEILNDKGGILFPTWLSAARRAGGGLAGRALRGPAATRHAVAVLARFGVVVEGDWLGYLITGFIGACILLFVVKLVRR